MGVRCRRGGAPGRVGGKKRLPHLLNASDYTGHLVRSVFVLSHLALLLGEGQCQLSGGGTARWRGCRGGVCCLIVTLASTSIAFYFSTVLIRDGTYRD